MKSFWKLIISATCAAAMCGAALLWPQYHRQAQQQKFAEAGRADRLRANHGDAAAQFRLGNSYHEGEGVPRDYAEAATWVRKAAAQGDVRAQYALGFSYAHGQGVPQDYTEAVRWYRKAAAKGYANAQYALGFFYARGQGVPQDYAEAIKWYRQAADQGDATAQNALGFMYGAGKGVPRDNAEALRWYRQAAGQGDKSVQAYLTVSYYKGDGAPRDYAEALHWLRKLAASCFATINGGPLGNLTSLLAILLLLTALVPQRHWGRPPWLSLAMLSAGLAAGATDQLLRIIRTIDAGTGSWDSRLLWLAVLTFLSTIYAIEAVARRAPHQRRSPT